MEYVIKGYKPEKLFNFFEEISSIPRGSGNEKGIADYIEKFAKERDLFCVRDDLHNVFIRKEATAGYENSPPVMLQGHTDMVCEKNAETDHDFEKDGLKLTVKNGILKAEGTTLGGDDGIAVAIMLYALDSDSIQHPTLECLFTTGEETGLYGATGFDYSVCSSKTLINLDSEEEGVATVSCAGGIGLDFTLKGKKVPIPSFARPLEISITGLSGGHSGADIHLQKGNANVLIAAILSALYEKHPFSLVSVSGGSRGNAIPREAKAVIFTDEVNEATDFVKEYASVIKSWLPKVDKGVKIRVSKAKGEYAKMYTFKDTVRYLSLVTLMPNGVISMMNSIQGMVQTSNNLGVVADNGDDGIFFVYHGRSSSESQMDVLEIKSKTAAKLLDLDLDINGRYSGWPMKEGSKLGNLYMSVAKKVYGEKITPRLAAIHAGLECGIISSHIPDLDAISIGPILKDIHSPDESLDLSSLSRLWDVVKAMLEEMK